MRPWIAWKRPDGSRPRGPRRRSSPVGSARSPLPCLLPPPWWLLALALGTATPVCAQAPGTWARIVDLNKARAEHTATLLPNGTVLIAGGKDVAGQPLTSAEIYNPVTGVYTAVSSPLPTPVWGHTATGLNDGTVLLAGGTGDGGLPVNAAVLYDPATDTFAALYPLSTPRARHTATLLRDGKVLIAGGTDGPNALASLEVYDPPTRTFSLAPSALLTPRQDHAATLLNDGRLLVAGGSNSLGALNSAELYDPGGSTVSPPGPLSAPRRGPSAAVFRDGTVRLAGGQSAKDLDLTTAEFDDPAMNSFTLLPALMSTARSAHTGLRLLHNGKVLLVGGTSAGQLVPTTEVYDPVTSVFRQVGSPTTARQLFGTNFFVEPYTGIFLMSGGLDSAQSPLASSEAFYYPTLRSDKPDYAPGEIVTLMGERWWPNETITINIHESSGDPDTNLTATADARGTFTNREFAVNAADSSVRFVATATGQASGWTAQTTFTDGNVKAMAAPSGTTFTLTKTTFSNTTCSGTGSTTTVTGVNSTSGNTTGVGSAESVKLEAAATSDQNTTFTNWSSSDPFTVVAPRAICVAGFTGGGTRNYFANYTAGADLSVTKTDLVTTVTAGDGVTRTYTITVSNTAGPSDATGVTLSDTWPSGFTRGTITPSQGTCTPATTGQNFTCALGTLAKGGSATVTVTYTVPASTTGSQTNTVTVSSDTPDPVPGNNTASDTNTVATSADLSVTKTDLVTTVTAGDGVTRTYTITVSNTAGPSDATGVTLSDTWPSGFTRGTITPSQGTCTPATTGQNFTCALGTLAKGS